MAEVPSAYNPGDSGTYWQGADGQVYVSGTSGVNAAGAWDNNSDTYWGGQGFKRTADPSTGDNWSLGSGTSEGSPNPSSTSWYSDTGGTGSTSPASSQQDMDYLNQQQSLYDRMMQSIGSTEQSGLKDINDSVTSARNSANTQRGRAMEDFGMKRQDSERGQTSALQRVGDNSRTLRNSLQRQLGLGASGGSAFMVADNAVARDASKNRAGVQESFGVNFRNLGTAEKRAGEDYESLLQEIEADKARKEEAFRGGIIGQRQSTQQALDQIASERIKLQGGNPLNNNLAYNNFNTYQGQLDALPGQFDRNVQARALKVETPQLRDYLVDRASIGGGQSKQTQYSPYSQFLQKNNDEEELQVR